MTYYFLDFENANQLGKEVNPDVKRGDEIHVFYSEQNKRISLEFLNEMVQRGVPVLLHKVSAGRKNSLDFQLTTYLGYKIGQQGKKNARYVIISADTDYDKVISFWQENGQTVERCATLMDKALSKKDNPVVVKSVIRSKRAEAGQDIEEAEAPQHSKQEERRGKKAARRPKQTKQPEEPQLSRKDVVGCLPHCTRTEVNDVLEIISRKGVTKHDVSNEISKAVKNTKKGGEIYQKIKPLLQKAGIR